MAVTLARGRRGVTKAIGKVTGTTRWATEVTTQGEGGRSTRGRRGQWVAGTFCVGDAIKIALAILSAKSLQRKQR